MMRRFCEEAPIGQREKESILKISSYRFVDGKVVPHSNKIGVDSNIDKSTPVLEYGAIMEETREILTPEQAADYLQVNRETIYRYIRNGRLVASKLGRSYRVPKRSLELLLWATRTHQDVTLREYSGREIDEFIENDRLDEKSQSIVDRFNSLTT